MNYRARENWSIEEEAYLIDLFNKNVSLTDIAKIIGRSDLAIVARLTKMQIRPSVTTPENETYQARNKRDFFVDDHNKSESLSDNISPGPPADVQQAFSRFYFVYGIVNCYKEIYIGSSHNVWNRVTQHNRNAGAKATRGRGPWYPFSIHCLASEEDARQLENLIHKDFDNYIQGYEKSLRQVLSQIGYPFSLSDIKKV